MRTPTASPPTHDTVTSALGVAAPGSALAIDGNPVLVVGVFDGLSRRKEVTENVLVLSDGANDRSISEDREMIIEVEEGSAALLGQYAAVLLRDLSVEVVVPPEAKQFRKRIEERVERLVVLGSALALVVGGIGVANVLSSSVAARRTEIGLRRVHGAGAAVISLQIIIEAAMIGFIGGAVGAVTGWSVAVIWAASSGWLAIADYSAGIIATGTATVVGMLAGVMPGVSAARVEPIRALRN